MSNLVINNHIITAPIIDILNQIKKELVVNKLQTIQFKGDTIRVNCPVHKDGMEAHPSCGIYCGDSAEIQYGSWNCFTCGEHGTLPQFVARCFDKSDDWGKSWLLDRFGDTFLENTLVLPEISLKKPKKEYLSEDILSSMQSWHPYMSTRKLTRQVCETFNVKYEPSTECLVFPVYDEKHRLWMLTKRSIKDKKFYIEVNKEKPIYLLYYIREKNLTEATLVESQINCLTLWSWGVPSIASFGCNITDKQLELINKSGIRHLYICYDGDDAGVHGTLKVIKGLHKDILVDVILMDAGKDVNDLSEDRFNQLPIISGEEWLKLHTKKIKKENI